MLKRSMGGGELSEYIWDYLAILIKSNFAINDAILANFVHNLAHF